MAYIFGKDLDNWDNSLITREPYAITDKDTSIGSQYVTGTDLLRSAKISPEWKQPVAQLAQAYSKTAISGQMASSYLTGLADSIAELPYNVENALAQRAIELVSGKEKDKSFTRKLYEGTEIGKLEKIGSTLLSLGIIIPGLMEDAKEIRQKATTYEEIVDLLNEREYPSAKYAQRIIAENTSAVENRRLVRELYNQSLGIDSSKWYNKAASIIGAMTPIIAASRFGYSTALRAGASRAGAIKVAENIVKGYVGLESAGQYAEETASEYLKRTGDKTFENFTAKDASGLAAMAYGAISGQIEVLGGVEPIMAGALSRVGLRSGLLKAGIKIGAGEATEEFLQSISEFLMRKMDNTTNKTWGEALKDALNGAAWGLFIGGITGSPAFYINRRNLVKGIRQALPNISDSQATQVADIMIDSVAEQSSQDPTLRQNLRNKIATMYETADIENKEDRIDAITDLEYALITADATWDGINIADHPLFEGEVNQLGWFRAGVSEQIRPVVNSLISELTDLQDQLKKLNEAKEKDWAKIDEIERKLEQFDRYVLDKLGENAPASIRALENELRKVEERYVAKEKKKAGIPVDVIKTTQTSDHDYGNVIQEDVVEESKNGVKYWFITDRNGGGRIRLLTPENKIIGQININKNGVRYLYLEPEYRSDKYGKLLWDEAQRFTNPSEVMATGREDTPVERAIGFWKKQGFKQVGETPKMTREIDKTKQLEPFPENQVSTAMFQEQFDLADENARLDDIYPAYEGETINIDGKDRTVYNSNGDRIAKSKEALINFWKWFGDSKVVDEQGRPLVVYHGTSSVFDTFDSSVGHITDSGFFGSGFYFTPIKSEAEYYGRIVMPVYLKIEKPFTISTGSYYSGLYDNLFEGGGQLLKDLGLLAENDLKDFNKYERLKKEFLKKAKVEKIYTYDAKHNEVKVWRASFEKDGRSYEANSYRPWEEIGYNEKADTKENALNNAWGEYAHFNDLNFLIQDLSFTDYIRTNGLAEELSNIIKSRGYDGTIAGDEHIVFEPNQIKSVDNRGTYSEKTGNIYYQPGFASMRGELIGDALDAEKYEGTGEGSSVWAWGNYLLKSQKIDKAHYFDQFNYSGKPIKYEGKELAQIFNTAFVSNTVKEMLEEGKSKEQAIQKIETGIGNLESKIKYITDNAVKTVRSWIPNAEEIVKDILTLVESKGVYFVNYEKDSPEYAIQEKYHGTDGYRFNNAFKSVWDAMLAYGHSEMEIRGYLTLLNEAEKDLAIFKNLDIKKFTGGQWFRYKNQNLQDFITNLMDEFITSSRYYGGREINNDLQKIFRDAIVKGKSFQEPLKKYVEVKQSKFEEDVEELKKRIISKNNLNERELKVLDDILAQVKLGGNAAKDTESILAVDAIAKGKYGHQYQTFDAQAYRDIYNKYEYAFKGLETGAQRIKALNALYNEFKDADIKDFDLKTKASMYEFDVPENKYLLDFTKSLERQSKHVKQALAKLYEETKLGDEPYDYTIKAINPKLPRIYKPNEILKDPKSYDDRVATYDGIIDNFLMAWKYHGLETAKKELDSLIVRQTHYTQEAKDNVKRLEKEKKTLDENASRMYYVNRDIEYNTNSANQHADYRDIAKFVKKKTDKIPADANIDDYADITYEFKYKETGLALYNSIKRSFSLTHNEEDIKLAKELNALNKEGNIRPQKATSKLLEKYGIKGVKYEGERDKTGFVTFGRTPMVERLFQNRVSGNAPATYRGAYIPQYRFIQRTNKMDASSLSHELAHDWFEVNFDKFRSGNADPEFMRAWGALEKALGITEKSTKAEKAKASETFARAYEGWIMNKPDWTKAINIDDSDKDAVIKLMQDYQNNLRDIYQDLTSPYFKQTWGKLGEMKPEIKNWFDKVINIRDLDVLVERGEITQEQANQERINQAIDTVIANTEDADTKRALQNAKVLNDTSRYEAEGGNKNSLQRRIATLAKAIDENNMLIKENYDTHRDMLEVAKQADNFVRTRLDDALAIINGQMAEQEGLFKEDIYTALERLALENGDLNLLDELKNSEIANRLAKELGQRVAGFRNWTAGEIDVVSTIKTLDNKFNQALKNKKAQAQMKEATELFESAQKEQDKLADKQLESTLKELECK